MKKFTFRIWLYFAIDCSILAVSLLHIPSLLQRATTPFGVVDGGDRLTVGQISDAALSGALCEGDKLVRFRDHFVRTPEEMEFLGDLASIGEKAPVEYQRGGETGSCFVTLGPYYPSLRFIVISLFAGIAIWGIGIYILWNGWHELVGRVLHWVMVFFAADVMLTWGAVLPNTVETVYRPVIFLFSYEVGVPVFFFFTALYPRRKHTSVLLIAAATFVPAALLCTASSYFYLKALSLSSIEHFDSFQSVYNIFHVAMILYIGGGIVNIVHAYTTSETSEDRLRLKWILWGLIVAAVPFLALYILPQIFFSRYLIDEEFTTIFFLVVPFTFAVSFMKYRSFDIDVVINRSIVYSVLTVFVAASYVLTVLILVSLIGGKEVFEHYLFVVGVSLLVAWLMNPLRKKVQQFIDESLFAARTNFRAAVMEMSEGLHAVISTEELFRKLASSVWKIIPAESVAVYGMDNGQLLLKARSGMTAREIMPLPDGFSASLRTSRTMAKPGALSFSGAGINLSESQCLADMGYAVCVPIRTEGGEVYGAVGVRPRSPNDRFDENEIGFVATLCAQTADTLDRMLLQERLVLEREAKKRSEELNALKSEFVSYVSHEFRTPLTSINMLVGLLRRRGLRRAKAARYLDVIHGEAERLGRMVTNLLDSARIENGIKEYTFCGIDLCAVVKKNVDAMKYQFKANKFSVSVHVPNKKLTIRADADAVGEAIVNLLANAVKYSSGKRTILVEVRKQKGRALCRITDRGDGISKEALPRVFEKFYRDPAHSGPVQGVGLGLSLVKHIMDVHRGEVSVQSELGKGSIFTLSFPLDHS